MFLKCNIYNPLIRTRTYAYQGVRNVSFSENFAYVLNGWPQTGLHLKIFGGFYHNFFLSSYFSEYLWETNSGFWECSCWTTWTYFTNTHIPLDTERLMNVQFTSCVQEFEVNTSFTLTIIISNHKQLLITIKNENKIKPNPFQRDSNPQTL